MIARTRAFNAARLATAVLVVGVLVHIGYPGQPSLAGYLLDVALVLVVIVYVTHSAGPTRMLGDPPAPSFFLRGRSGARDLGLALLLVVPAVATMIAVTGALAINSAGQRFEALSGLMPVPVTFLGIAVLMLVLRAIVTWLRALLAWALGPRR